jgi:hypothetical protein
MIGPTDLFHPSPAPHFKTIYTTIKKIIIRILRDMINEKAI